MEYDPFYRLDQKIRTVVCKLVFNNNLSGSGSQNVSILSMVLSGNQDFMGECRLEYDRYIYLTD